MRFTITFGFGHECRCGRSLSSCYTHVDGDSEEHARERMVSVWGIKWACCYSSDDAAGVAEHQLKRIATNFDDPDLCPCSRGPRPDFALVPLHCFECDARAGAVLMPPEFHGQRCDIQVMCERCREILRRLP